MLNAKARWVVAGPTGPSNNSQRAVTGLHYYIPVTGLHYCATSPSLGRAVLSDGDAILSDGDGLVRKAAAGGLCRHPAASKRAEPPRGAEWMAAREWTAARSEARNKPRSALTGERVPASSVMVCLDIPWLVIPRWDIPWLDIPWLVLDAQDVSRA